MKNNRTHIWHKEDLIDQDNQNTQKEMFIFMSHNVLQSCSV